MTELQKIIITPDNGVTKEILKYGHGTKAQPGGCCVSVHYIGKFIDGSIFDSTVERGQPFEFELGKHLAIVALEIGISTMRVGEKCNLICAPEYAYGALGNMPTIPPNATLIFEIELLAVRGVDVSPNSDGSIEMLVVESCNKKRSPTEGAKVKVHLIGTYNGINFEDREVKFYYDEGGDCDVIPGVEIALAKMTLGETSKLKIKHDYAFGSKGNEKYKIPPYSTVEYIVKLIECGKGIDKWKLHGEEVLEEAIIIKERGTNYFKKENYDLAIKMYEKAISYVEYESSEDWIKIRIDALCNIALCYQKLDEQLKARQTCDKVLALDPQNVKALFRRGQCNLTLQDLHEAVDDFSRVLMLTPHNKAAQNQLQICKHKMKESKQQEKIMYTQMFSKLGINDNEPNCRTEPDVLETCGEWTDEEAMREADRAFERDNNIVMI